MKAIAAGIITSLVVMTGCSGSSSAPTSPAPPSTVVPRTELPTVPSSPTEASTVPTTIAPTTAPPSTLPFGNTDADRAALEGAAKAWWAEWTRQILALPKFDPNGFFELAEPGSPGAAEYAAILEKLSEQRLKAIPPKIDQVVVLSVEFKSATRADVLTCTADDGGLLNADTGKIASPSTLGRGRHSLSYRKGTNGWMLTTTERVGTNEKGKTCDDSF